jgi:hypothetical protein
VRSASRSAPAITRIIELSRLIHPVIDTIRGLDDATCVAALAALVLVMLLIAA